jgi:DNA-binding MarR family transcriptional regulator
MSTMVDDRSGDHRRDGRPLGPALRRAWVGYQRRLDEAMASEGFADRRFPNGRVLRVCAAADATDGPDRPQGGATIAHIGRELGMSRQGAAKIVADLRERGFLAVTGSATSGREKTVRLTPRAVDYLAAQARSARAIEASIEDELGPEVFVALDGLVDALDGDDQPRMRDYLRDALDRGGPD